jgi:hypothetical protein
MNEVAKAPSRKYLRDDSTDSLAIACVAGEDVEADERDLSPGRA